LLRKAERVGWGVGERGRAGGAAGIGCWSLELRPVGRTSWEMRNWFQKRVGWSSPRTIWFGLRVGLGEAEANIY